VSCQTYLTISIDGHTFTVIEADGVEHQPLEVDSLTIFDGQRYSIIVNANQTVGNYCKFWDYICSTVLIFQFRVPRRSRAFHQRLLDLQYVSSLTVY
jgi:FtsP/CotA-like multicopper oxidase with cupredoxin domain